jgi:hypothetical protein
VLPSLFQSVEGDRLDRRAKDGWLTERVGRPPVRTANCKLQTAMVLNNMAPWRVRRTAVVPQPHPRLGKHQRASATSHAACPGRNGPRDHGPRHTPEYFAGTSAVTLSTYGQTGNGTC